MKIQMMAASGTKIAAAITAMLAAVIAGCLLITWVFKTGYRLKQ